MFLRFFALILLFCAALPWAAAQNPAPPLHRGLNLSNWLANAARQPITERDMQQIAAAGFDHIRLPVNPEFFGFTLDQQSVELDFKPVDAALAMAFKYHLAVILDMHPSLAFMDALEKDPQGEENFVQLWDLLAHHFDEAHYPTSQLVLELLNEPHYYHAEDHYRQLAQKLVDTIRRSSPQRVIIVAAPHGSSIDGLRQIEPIKDSNILYDFHFYEPYIITHQGIHRGFPDKMLRFFHDFPYPADRVDHEADFYAAAAPDQGEAEKELRDYVQDGWNADVIAKRITAAHEWAMQHNVRLICGEFGVLRNHIDAASRYRWIADVRKELDSHHIPWELWDYADLMGIVQLQGDVAPADPIDGSLHLRDVNQGARMFEPEALKALLNRN